MKKRIVIERQDIIYNDIVGLKRERVVFPEGYKKIENVLETFEELKLLCKNLKNPKTSTGIVIKDDYVEFHGLLFLASGIVCHETEIDKNLAIVKNRTIAQMWNIIKNLTE